MCALEEKGRSTWGRRLLRRLPLLQAQGFTLLNSIAAPMCVIRSGASSQLCQPRKLCPNVQTPGAQLPFLRNSFPHRLHACQTHSQDIARTCIIRRASNRTSRAALCSFL